MQKNPADIFELNLSTLDYLYWVVFQCLEKFQLVFTLFLWPYFYAEFTLEVVLAVIYGKQFELNMKKETL